MDGLLFDSEALYQRAMLAAAEEGGHDITPVIHKMVGRTWEQSKVMLTEHYGPTFPVDVLMLSMSGHFKTMAATDLAMKPGVVELLDLLEERGMPFAIATSSSHPTVQGHLAAHNLEARFHKIIAHGDYARSKPAPDPYLKAAEELGVLPHLCLALEDSHNGVRSAAAAGMMTVMVPDLLEATEEIQALCVLIARDLHEVRGLMGDGPIR